jgi:tetratricopeptide (TPR) repeat protein
LTLLDRGDNAAAAPVFLRAAELMPGQAKPVYLAGLAFERSQKYAEAIHQFEQASATDPNSFDIFYHWALTLVRMERFADAVDPLRKAIALRPDFKQARTMLASTLVFAQKPDEAAAVLTEYLNQNPNDGDARMQLAAVLNDIGKPIEALAELDRADSTTPASVDRLKLRASIMISQKDWDMAARVLLAAVEAAPNDSALRAELGRILLEKRDFTGAERELRRALSIHPDEPGALGNLITTVYLAGNYPAALQLLDVQEKRMAATPIMLFVRATCYDKLHRNAEAAAAYQKFLDANQGRDDKEEFQARERLKVLLRELPKK